MKNAVRSKARGGEAATQDAERWSHPGKAGGPRTKGWIASIPCGLPWPQFSLRLMWRVSMSPNPAEGPDFVSAYIDELHPVAFASCALSSPSPPERNYSIKELQTLAVVWLYLIFTRIKIFVWIPRNRSLCCKSSTGNAESYWLDGGHEFTAEYDNYQLCTDLVMRMWEPTLFQDVLAC